MTKLVLLITLGAAIAILSLLYMVFRTAWHGEPEILAKNGEAGSGVSIYRWSWVAFGAGAALCFVQHRSVSGAVAIGTAIGSLLYVVITITSDWGDKKRRACVTPPDPETLALIARARVSADREQAARVCDRLDEHPSTCAIEQGPAYMKGRRDALRDAAAAIRARPSIEEHGAGFDYASIRKGEPQ